MATKASAYTTIYRILAFLLVSQSLYSQYSDMLAVDPRLRLGVSYLTHVDAHFSGPALSFSPAYEAGQYDNGYVKESAYNSTSKTWNWGFDSNSQLQGDELISYSTTSFSGSGISLSPQEGSAGLRFDWVPQTKTFGRRIAFNSLLSMDARKFSIEDRRELPANFETITKYHSHAGIDPTLLTLPHAGTYEDPGPLLALAASNSKSYTQDNEASLHRYMGLDGFLFTLGAGGEVHLAVTRRLSFFLQAQLLANLYFGKFEYGEYFSLNQPYGEQNVSHGISEMLFGLSGGAGFQWRFGDYSSLLFSVSKMINQELKGNESGYEYGLDFYDGYHVVAGIQIEY